MDEIKDPKHVIPVTSGKPSDSNVETRRYLDSIFVEMRVIDSIEADITFNLFGNTFDSPIMMPAFSHLNKAGEDGQTPMQEYTKAAKALNVMNWIGMEPNDEYGQIVKDQGPVGRIIKPFKNHQKILEEIDVAIKLGASAVGIDIDHSIGSDGHYDVVDGIELGPITMEDLMTFVEYSSVPFVAKGVLSVQDAIKCKEAGVKALFISHHHGRMKYAMPPLSLLPEIRKAVGEDMLIFVDCHIDSGYDAYKALALGANAVSVGRGILVPLMKDGQMGVITKVNQMNEELREMMGYTHVEDLNHFDASVLHIRHKYEDL